MLLNKEVMNDLIMKYGEAFYLADSQQFRRNFLELKEGFSGIYSNFNIAYSYKTNYIPKFCRIINELGGYAEVVSEMELELALRCGARPEKIIWNGPIKNPEMIKSFLLDGGTINVDSKEEAEYIKGLAKTAEQPFNVGIRCNFDVNDGVISRFGLDVEGEDFKKVLDIVAETKNIHFINFQCHFARRQIEYWHARANGMIKLINKFGIIPERIDIGGGMFGKMDDSLKTQFSSEIPSYKAYAKAAATVFLDYFQNKDFKPELLIEPGTAIVGDCMKYVGTVKTIKNIRGKQIASILGSQKNISMEQVNPPIEVIHMGGKVTKYENLDMVGYTCIEGDILYKGYRGYLAKGDVVVFSNCGSYSLVMKPPFILPNVPVLDLCEEQVEVIKRKETFDDIFHTFHFTGIK